MTKTVVLVALLTGSGLTLTSCSEKDELMDEPSWLGNSIYERLNDEGSYRYTLKLIDDLGQKDVLSQTGSKTVFVSDDNTYDQFFSQKLGGRGNMKTSRLHRRNCFSTVRW